MFLYKTIKEFLTKNECKNLLDFSLENLKLTKSEIGKENTAKYQKDVRDSQISFYSYDNEFPLLRKKIEDKVTIELNLKGIDITFKEKIQFTEYKIGQFYNWHKDNNQYNDRYCSIVIQLNDEYTEGNLELIDPYKNETIVFENGIGNMFIFLSHLQHRVTPITSGIRYSLVSWLGMQDKLNFKKTLL